MEGKSTKISEFIGQRKQFNECYCQAELKAWTKINGKNYVGNLVRKVHDLKEIECLLFLPDFIETKLVMWKFHVKESTNGKYDMILSRDLLTALGLDLKFSWNIIIDK